MDPTLAKLQRRLERWELEHLRDHAAQLDAALTAARETISKLQDELAGAESRAEWWREQVMQMQEDMPDDLAIGITRDGQMGVVPRQPAGEAEAA